MSATNPGTPQGPLSEPEASSPQVSIAGAGGLQLSVWMFRLSAALLFSGVATTALGISLGSTLIRSGLIALMATPALRVVDLMVGYIQRRDWGTVAAMLAVLMVVAATLLVALS